MSKIIDYKILTEFEGSENLEAKVKAYMTDGWQPIGGATVTGMVFAFEPGKTTYVWTQAVIKYEA